MKTLASLSLAVILSACGSSVAEDDHEQQVLEAKHQLEIAELQIELAKVKTELARAQGIRVNEMTKNYKPSEREVSDAELVYRLKSLKIHKDILNSLDTSKLDAHMRFQREQQLAELRKLEKDIEELRK